MSITPRPEPPEPNYQLALLDAPVGPACSICTRPRIIVLPAGALLCASCDGDWPDRAAVVAWLLAEAQIQGGRS